MRLQDITIEIILANINDNYQPTDTELIILLDIVRDQKLKILGRAFTKYIDSVYIMEIFNYKIFVDPNRLKKLTDKKRLMINSHGKKDPIMWQFRRSCKQKKV